MEKNERAELNFDYSIFKSSAETLKTQLAFVEAELKLAQISGQSDAQKRVKELQGMVPSLKKEIANFEELHQGAMDRLRNTDVPNEYIQ